MARAPRELKAGRPEVFPGGVPPRLRDKVPAMRDTSLLRQRLHTALAWLPLATAGLGCGEAGSPVKPAPVALQAPANPIPEATPVSAPPTAPTPAPASPYPARTGQDPFDPDGIEEEGCPNGDWCGTVKVAEKISGPTAEHDMACPTRIIGSVTPRPRSEERLFKGLSLNPMMQGRLRRIATTELRKTTGDEDQCCYHWFDYCSGRPLLDDDLASVRAPLQAGDTWLNGHVADDRAAALPLATRRALASLWLDDARSEHAAVASFARATLELLAVGAPPELVFACQQSSLDEIRHTQTCFTLAALYVGEAAEPGPLPMLAPRDGGLVALACATLVEGCVGETIAALAALRASRGCEVAPVQSALAGIAEDETRHAELAWATLAFAVHRGGAGVADAVRRLAAELMTASTATQTAATQTDILPPALLAAHGRLSFAALAQVRHDAWQEIIGPTLELVLAGDAPPSEALLS